MSREAVRVARRGGNSAAGNAKMELKELRKLQEGNQMQRIQTITVTCSSILTVVCC